MAEQELRNKIRSLIPEEIRHPGRRDPDPVSMMMALRGIWDEVSDSAVAPRTAQSMLGFPSRDGFIPLDDAVRSELRQPMSDVRSPQQVAPA